MRQISFEFFPPKTEAGAVKLLDTVNGLKHFDPEFLSVTFGAGGSTQSGTLDTVHDLLKRGFQVAPHLSCIGMTKSQIRGLLFSYQTMGVKRIVALRGDLPSGMASTEGDFHYAADLVRYIREVLGNAVHIEVAAYPEMHPQSENYHVDVRRFADKVHAGADSAITQYFFNADAYLRFRDMAHGSFNVDVPIVPGIMPIANYPQLVRFSSGCGAEIPRWMRLQMESYKEPAAQRQVGVDIITKMCERLQREGVRQFHFYTLNGISPVKEIIDNLLLGDQRQ